MFSVRSGREAGAVVLWLRGELDHHSVVQLEDATDGLPDGGDVVVVDLGAVTFCDSSGLSGLVRLGQVLATRGAVLRLAGVPAGMLKTLSLTGLDQVLHVFPDVAGAARADVGDEVGAATGGDGDGS
ncbi:STAS domain-containing protein [Saccharothrix sp. MB29]|nr:STAS domain-containing protein [Saccharothrix sp. MB29]